MSADDRGVLDTTVDPTASETVNLTEASGSNLDPLVDASSDRVNNNDVSQGFRMESQLQQQQMDPSIRKRKRDGPLGAADSAADHSSMKLSSSSSSSSDEDEDSRLHFSAGSAARERWQDRPHLSEPSQQIGRKGKEEGDDEKPSSPDADAATKEAMETQHAHQQQPQQQQQPEGWRVKLYRLNADGSWDDCGTGRILCLYKQPTKGDAGNVARPPTPPNPSLSGDAWIYQELGEPTLCMQSEVSMAGSAPAPRILLRTRILLRDAYQRQGDNIITWCEPYLEEGNPTQGVDLALSFQDNAGCLDIWRQITQVQSRAADLFRRSGGGGGGSGVAHNPHANQLNNHNINPKPLNASLAKDSEAHNNSSNSNNVHNDNTGGLSTTNGAGIPNGSSVVDVAHAVAAAHHANLQRQQQQEMWVNVSSEAAQHHLDHQNSAAERHRQHHHEQQQQQHHHQQQQQLQQHQHHFEDAVGGMVAAYHESNAAQIAAAQNAASPQMPNPPTLGNLEEIADMIAAVQVRITTSCVSELKNVSFLCLARVARHECLLFNNCFSILFLTLVFPAYPAARDTGHVYISK
jgi:hypothetical protein